MEKKNLSEVALLKLQNISLSLQILQMQAKQLLQDRDQILKEECNKLDCNLDEWYFDERDGCFTRRLTPSAST